MSGFSRYFLVLALFLAALGCTNRRGGGGRFDTGVMPMGDADTTDSSFEDTSAPFDTGTMDSGVVDSGRPDTSTPFDSGTMDTGIPDTGTPDSGLPITDSGLPLGDGGICIPGMVECPVGQMCCEILPGTGIGMCMPTCP
jgi:hypothetical protein